MLSLETILQVGEGAGEGRLVAMEAERDAADRYSEQPARQIDGAAARVGDLAGSRAARAPRSRSRRSRER